MVEAAGIEPASEGGLTPTSTCVVFLLSLARPGRLRRASRPRQARYVLSPAVAPPAGFEARCLRLSPLADRHG